MVMETDKERAEHYRNAISNYMGVLNLHGSDIEKKLQEADKGLTFPENPIDILEYLGNIEPLEMTDQEKKAARRFIQNSIKGHGTKEVWQYRMRYKLEWYYVERMF